MELELYEAVRPKLLKAALRYCKVDDRREELVDDAMIKLALKYKGPQLRDDMVRWGMKTIYYGVMNMNRARKEKLCARTIQVLNIEREKRLAGPVEIDELSTEMLDALNTLPVKQRNMLVLFAQSYTYEEIASILSVPLGTVMSGLFRARASMKKELEVAC